ncbi:MAG: hypothetical protein MI753_08720 [Hyphomicrobiales bacterium]|nr:hypothetical protein [Hyphomicrobiales bacterium]
MAERDIADKEVSGRVLEKITGSVGLTRDETDSIKANFEGAVAAEFGIDFDLLRDQLLKDATRL